MLAKEMIMNAIPPLKTSDTGTKALRWMDEYKVSHLPIVNNVDFLGLISDSDILSMNTPEEALGNHKLSLIRPYVTQNQHFYDVLRVLSEENLTLIPVLDDSNEYLGSITINCLVQNFSKMTAVQNPGGIIILELHENDYCLSQIAQIVESNDTKIISLYISSVDSHSTKFNLTLKLNKTDISAVLRTFERYNYIVKGTFNEDTHIEDLKQRYDSFMKYLDL